MNVVRLVLRTVRHLLDRRERFQFVAVAVLVLAGVALELVGLGLFLPIVALLTDDEFIGQVRERVSILEDASDTQIVVIALGLLVAVFIVKNLFAILSMWYQRTVVARISARLTQELFVRYLHRDYSFHVRNNSSTLMRNLQNASGVITSGVEPMIAIATDGLIAMGIVGLLIAVEPIPALSVVLIYGTVGFGLFRIMRRRILHLGKQRNIHNALTLKHQQQGLNAIKTLIVTGRREVFTSEHQRHVLANKLISRTYGLIQQFPRMWIEILTVVSLSVLVVIVVAQGREVSDSLPILGLFAVAAFRIQPSVVRMVLSLQELMFSSAAVASVEQEFQDQLPINRATEVEKFDFERLRLESVSFNYDPDLPEVLAEVTMSICKGERVGITGRSGSGKTTLIDLILGLIVPTSGLILVNEQAVSEDPRRWQRTIGFVPQDVYLLDDTIERNVAFGLPMTDEVREQVVLAVDRAQLGPVVASMPAGLESVVGERGVRLSGGQRQRIGIARALMEDPPVMIFDEATSSLDLETEREVLDAINKVAEDRTVIVVAHRASTLAICDRIVRVDGGSVVELGPPTRELLRKLAGELDDESVR